jgi:poly(3-hydroxybutyrate) depolymerase
MLHGDSSMATGAGIENTSGLSDVAAQQCFIAAYPSAVAGIWDNVADVGFIQAVVADIEAQDLITANRRFLIGHSGGARLAGKISCTWSSEIAAFAQVSYVLRNSDTRDCANAPAKPVLIMHGTGDLLNPHNGNATQLSAQESAEFWAEKFGTSSPFVSDFYLKLDNGKTEVGQLSSWSAPVKFYSLTGGGHPFPSSHPDTNIRSKKGGPTVTEIGNETLDPGAEVIWTFFKAQ